MPSNPADMDEGAAARLLGVDVDSDPAAVRTAFRTMAKRAHPDCAVGQVRLNIGELVAARDRLLAGAERRARSRAAIDAEGRQPHHPPARRRPQTRFDDQVIDLTTPLGHLVDITG